MKTIKLLIKLLIWGVISVIFYFTMSFLVAYWMISGGWTFEEHHTFFVIWTIIPSAIVSTGVFYELVIEHLKSRK